jgi:hypothetical protein
MLNLEPERREIIAIAEMYLRELRSPQRSSCLVLQILSVETNSFLPNNQSDRGNFAGRREVRY